jgi:endonuclease/exonuclease/phosphatase family metal-dependent hydrolase
MKTLLLILLTSTATLAQSLKVMTYNIRYDNPGDGVNQWSQRKNKVFALFRKYDPDIIGVQEALHHQLEDIVKALPQYAYVGVGRDDGKTKGEYSAILYKKKNLNITDQNTFWLSETPQVPGSKDWDAAITRIATWAILKDRKSAKDFFVLNTHFDHIGQEARKNSAVIIKNKIKELAPSLPVIVTGDFNCTREDAPYAVMLEKDDLILEDPAPADPPGTFCSFVVNSIECSPIDYIFHSRHWHPSDYRVIDDHDGKHYPSDHLPVQVTVKR